MSTSDKDLPDDFQELRAEYQYLLERKGQLQEEIPPLERKLDRILTVAALGPYLEEYWRLIEALKPSNEFDDGYILDCRDDVAQEELDLTKAEKLAKHKAEPLYVSIQEKLLELEDVKVRIKLVEVELPSTDLGHEMGAERRHLDFVRVQATVEGIDFPEGSGSGGKKRKRPGPKGPRQPTIARRAAVKLLKGRGITGHEACRKLNEMGIPLPSKRLRESYHDDWVE